MTTAGPMPWLPAVATSIGSFPGTSAFETARIIAGELPDFLHVAELPARGPGADMIGRTGGLLTAVSDVFALETTPDGWRIAGAVGRQMRRSSSYLAEDLDALESIAEGYAGPVKVQVAGPWTLAASIELRTGERALRDEAACWDIAQALAEAIGHHVADVQRRVPHASRIVVQVDEPALPAVLAGRIGTASGLSSYRAVDGQVAERALRLVLASRAGELRGVHCCSSQAPVDLLRASGASFVSLDFVLLEHDRVLDDSLGRAWESGMGVVAGSVPAIGVGPLGDRQASAPLRAVLHRLGLEDPRWLAQVAVTPACGMAGASPAWVRDALAACIAVGRIVRNDSEEASHE